ncbi:hypothetical protein [Frankia sp. R43]|uniref:hypothetical protein n=1 Tax=Frankia sp. R43 TaxID=269536 RepID=UPI00128EBE89|nr:hypothetical protein [Frankia sp. R43]
MNDETVNELAEHVRTSLESVKIIQEAYDEVGWQIKDPALAKVRHMLLHLMKVTTEVAVIVEDAEHRLHDGTPADEVGAHFTERIAQRGDIAGHLLFHAAQLANIGSYNLGQQLLEVYAENSQRFAPNSVFVGIDQRRSPAENSQ